MGTFLLYILTSHIYAQRIMFNDQPCFQVAQSLCGEDHIVKGVSVHVSNAAPKTDPARAQPGYPRASGQARDKGQSPFGPGPAYGAGGGIGLGGGAGQGWNQGPGGEITQKL